MREKLYGNETETESYVPRLVHDSNFNAQFAFAMQFFEQHENSVKHISEF